MCGIVGVIGKSDVYSNIIDCLRNLEYRGYDSAGIAVITDDAIRSNKGIGGVNHVFDDKPFIKGNIGIGHTRWATHGGVTVNNAHPHLDCKNKIAIAHNGIIDNYSEIKEKLGDHVFKSETDSEVIAHLIEQTGLPLKAAMFAIPNALQGQYAIVGISVESGNIVAIRRGNPLVVGISPSKMFIASDPNAFPKTVKQIVPIDDNELVELQPTGYTVFDLDTQVIKTKDPQPYRRLLATDTKLCRMQLEMQEQPDVLLTISRQDKELYMDMAMEVLRARRVIFTGCGTSKHAALAGRYAISTIANELCDVVLASELEYFANSIDRHTLIIALSQSGETSDVLRAVQIARQHGAQILSLVNAPLSSLERISDYTLPLCCGPEISVASTKAFTAQICTLYLLSYAMKNRFDEGARELANLGLMLKTEIANHQEQLHNLAQLLSGHEHMYYLGRGVNYPLACEGALKMKEIAYIQAESFPSGEMKHGPLALIENGTPVVGICPKDDTYFDSIANLHEAKARGATIIGVSDEYSEMFDHWIPIQKVAPLFYPIVATIPLHMLSYLVSLAKGINPDRPRNLAKSVTVR